MGRPATGSGEVTGTRSVARALEILQAVTPDNPGVSAAAVAARFGYSVPTAHRLLRALAREGFLEFDRITHQFRPGPEILRLTALLLAHDHFIPRVYESLARLRDATGETATLHWRMGDARAVVHELPGTTAPPVPVGLGRRFPLARGAAGKALLAVTDDVDLRRVLTGSPGPAPTGWRAELDAVRRTGLARSYGETIAGAASIATPMGGSYRAIAALSLTGPVARFGAEQQAAAAAVLLDEAVVLQARSHLAADAAG